MNFLLEYRGELAALTAAAIWAVSATIYGQIGKTVSPLLLNLSKGILAIGYLLIAMVATGQRFQIAAQQWWLLMLSGLVGIALGDTVFFMAINAIGARLTLLISMLSPVITAILASFYLQEQLSSFSYAGIVIVVFGIAGVIADRTQQAAAPQEYWQGISYALLSALANSIASICSRQAMLDSDLSPTLTTLIRLIAGTSGILILLFLVPRKHQISAVIDRKMWLRIGITAFFSTYIGISLQQTALKFSAAGIAQTLGATSPLFILIFDGWRGEKISWRSIFFAVMAISGMGLLFR
jgi:drug/metabolite transporter (DMT)-like permease